MCQGYTHPLVQAEAGLVETDQEIVCGTAAIRKTYFLCTLGAFQTLSGRECKHLLPSRQEEYQINQPEKTLINLIYKQVYGFTPFLLDHCTII